MICMFITTTLREKCYHYCHSVMKEQSGRAPRPAQGHTAANWRMLLPSTQARASHSLTLLTPSPAEGRLCASTDVAHTSVRFATSCFCPTINRIMKQEQMQGKLPIKVFKVGVLNLERVALKKVSLHQLRPTGGRGCNRKKCLLSWTPSGKVAEEDSCSGKYHTDISFCLSHSACSQPLPEGRVRRTWFFGCVLPLSFYGLPGYGDYAQNGGSPLCSLKLLALKCLPLEAS
ncbi:uncharacterized protein LOC111097324 isoform X2 [Canis lupus familiaris]|uniref:uncharacterized protein LOC111097324 isoform X2 n=1 Tax=Canis lupus familiaris TaxID=9615 RepID=UPI000BAA1142|nr:uncharacterized protein LOC111097324 isoform X2 [Canis lupus familiaris]XP_025292275.1 uncharacterized protein LOC112652874 isoform X2 [Canis lupus dingo]XP_038402735.1 uncharacterized protein LOC111097324 isoform X2 [Canis lupus familiaris]XP_038532004.1 uncharacterized protein LOC111097324 isoform X2 [Canis lupus familiaris]|eukprot:XP_022278566.1 uncharacterized protein LOC111097324 isoform X1 [Canis lupus familiaris]